ncbi:MAG: DNA polymerase [Nitrososphaerales archaeon]
MIVEADSTALEWRVAVFLSQDRVGLQEILDGVDPHALNKERFGLPERVIAKVFLFRLIYGGNAYSYAHDSDFMHVSTKEKYWQKIIDQTYEKYQDLYQWHQKIKETVRRTGQLVIPSGRVFKYSPKPNGDWPDTIILNYPVQGFSADLMMLARIAIYRRLISYCDKGILLVNTVHDSILVDCKPGQVDFVCRTMKDVFKGLAETASQCFRIVFNVPMDCKIKVGPNWGNMEEWNEIQS